MDERGGAGGKVLALDLGARRIGVAVSNSAGTMALPHSVIPRSGDARADHASVASLVAEVAADRVVVGLPLSLDGSRGPAARAAADEAAALRAHLPVPVEMVDERLTTVAADRSLAGAGVGGRGRRQVVDQVAASVILQGWLDRRRHGHGG